MTIANGNGIPGNSNYYRDIPLYIAAWGPVKTCKTSLGLSFPKPMVIFDLDMGIHRALPRYLKENPNTIYAMYSSNQQGMVSGNLPYGQGIRPDISVKTYPMPVSLLSKHPKGILSLWEQLMGDVAAACEDDGINSIVIDTGTMLRKANVAAHLERVQRNNSNRSSLIQIEYAQPNQEIRSILRGPRNSGKNLYIPHHVGGVYQSVPTSQGVQEMKVGDTWDGFSEIGALMDIVLVTRVDRLQGGVICPMAKVETCGYSLELEGFDIVNPSYEGIKSYLSLYV